jgi:hypothetical protein
MGTASLTLRLLSATAVTLPMKRPLGTGTKASTTLAYLSLSENQSC